MSDVPEILIRDAGPADAEGIAALHVASWRAAYRGMLADAYLDGPIEADRRQVWSERFAAPDPRRILVVAQSGSEPVAFACLAAGDDPVHGTLIDNLHAAPGHLGQGLGGQVLAAAIDRLPAADRERPIHLFVLEPNARARAVYASWGGAEVEALDSPEPDGSCHSIIRVAWPSVRALRERLRTRPAA